MIPWLTATLAAGLPAATGTALRALASTTFTKDPLQVSEGGFTMASRACLRSSLPLVKDGSLSYPKGAGSGFSTRRILNVLSPLFSALWARSVFTLTPFFPDSARLTAASRRQPILKLFLI